jgi:hypothetical protein
MCAKKKEKRIEYGTGGINVAQNSAGLTASGTSNGHLRYADATARYYVPSYYRPTVHEIPDKLDHLAAVVHYRTG